MKSFLVSTPFARAALAVALLFALFSSWQLGAAVLLAAGTASHLAAQWDARHLLGVINTSAVSNTIQPHYSKKLLGRAVQMTRLLDFAQLEAIEPGTGATSVRFYRPPQADLTATGAPAALTENTAPTDFRDISYTAVDVSLGQRGQVAKVSDIANTVGLVKYLDTTIDLFGDEFALDVDTIIRDKLVHASTGFTKRYAQGLANFAAISPATLANSVLIPRDFLDAMTRLKLNRAPMINGHYVAIVPPQGTRDIMNNSEFREVVRQNYADKIFKGEIGDYYGLRIIEGTNPFTEDETEGTLATTFSAADTNTTGFVYSTIITGKGGYGAVDMKKLGGVSKKPQIIVVDKPDSGNPLNQFVIVGWKAYWASVVLNTSWGITLRHKTQFA
jgi:N4-gp56 family major capsid protein